MQRPEEHFQGHSKVNLAITKGYGLLHLSSMGTDDGMLVHRTDKQGGGGQIQRARLGVAGGEVLDGRDSLGLPRQRLDQLADRPSSFRKSCQWLTPSNQ